MIPETEIAVRLVLGAVMGGVVGFERQVHGRPAGFRTHLLLCTAMVLLMIVSEHYHELSAQDPSYIRVDPARIAMGAITGIGFLGAGVIIKTGSSIMGLTTAASLWTVSAIGLALGTGMYMPASIVFVIAIFALLVLGRIESHIPSVQFKSFTITGTEALDEASIKEVFERRGGKMHNVGYTKDSASGEFTCSVTVSFWKTSAFREVLDEISEIEHVKRVSLKD